MNQPPLPLGREQTKLEAFQCHYCLDTTAVNAGDIPFKWGKSPTGKNACEKCRNAIDTFARELAEQDMASLPGAMVQAIRALHAPKTPPRETPPDPADDGPPEPC